MNVAAHHDAPECPACSAPCGTKNGESIAPGDLRCASCGDDWTATDDELAKAGAADAAWETEQPPNWALLAPESETIEPVDGWHGVNWFLVRSPAAYRVDKAEPKTKYGARLLWNIITGQGAAVDLDVRREVTGAYPKLGIPPRVWLDEHAPPGEGKWAPGFNAAAFDAFAARSRTAKLVEAIDESGGPAAALVGMDSQGDPCALLLGHGHWSPDQEDEDDYP